MRRGRRAALAAVGALVCALPWACGLDLAGTLEVENADSAPARTDATDATGTDGKADADAATDAPPACLTTCNGTCRPSPSCADCPDATVACPGATTSTCVADCEKGCGAQRIGCFECVGGGAPVGRCYEPDAAVCLQSPASYMHCACAGGTAGTCPGANQVCVGNQCRSCGEPNTDEVVCKTNVKCHGLADDDFRCRN